MKCSAIAALFLATMAPQVASAAEIIDGPRTARVVRVIDGDTFKATTKLWFRQTLTVSVRLVGVDTPEINGKCVHERYLAMLARLYAEKLLPKGSTVVLRSITEDAYKGRIDAQVTLADGTDLAATLIDNDLGRPYTYKGKKRKGWCGDGLGVVSK